MFFANFLIHVTKNCDCDSRAQEKVVSDIGILASYDPVAIDQATVDLLTKAHGGDLLQELWPENDYNFQIAHAEGLGLGSREYELIPVDED